MKDELKEIRQYLQESRFTNEEQVRISIVLRILKIVGWDIWNPNEVKAEFNPVPTEDSTRVDFALFLNSYYPPTVFIEVKSVGRIESELTKIEQQLRDYNRNNTAQFSVITDGQQWRFYYSQTGGEFSQKCFKIVDIITDEFDDIITVINKFLSKTEILNGNAKIEAEKYLKLNLKQRAMEDALLKAKRLVLEPPFPSLPEAVFDLVRKQGIEISKEEAKYFVEQSKAAIIKIEGQESPSPTSFTPSQKTKPFDKESVKENTSFTDERIFHLASLKNMPLAKSKPYKLIINAEEIAVNDWKDVSVNFVKFLIKKKLLTFSSLPVYNASGRDKYYISDTPKHQNPERDGNWNKVGQFYVDTKYSAEVHVKNIMSAQEQLNLKVMEIKIGILS